jgi:tyrosyl-tRNA synthetase
MLKNKGIKIDDQIINDEKKIIGLEEFLEKNYIKLSIGKKIHLKVTAI